MSMSSLPAMEKQIDEAISTFEALSPNPINNQKHRRGIAKIDPVHAGRAITMLIDAMELRVSALEQFYKKNELDPKAIKIEAMRVKLKRFLKSSAVLQRPAAPVVVPTIQHQYAGQETIVLKVILTHKEYEEVLTRRAIMNEMAASKGGHTRPTAEEKNRLIPPSFTKR